MTAALVGGAHLTAVASSIILLPSVSAPWSRLSSARERGVLWVCWGLINHPHAILLAAKEGLHADGIWETTGTRVDC